MNKHATLKNGLIVFLAISLLAVSSHLFSQSQEPLSIEKISGEVYALYGAGGNIGLLKGKDGLLVVDSSYARTANDVKTEIGKFNPLKILYLINTHYHGDHTGGNPVVGQGAQIIGHENCRASMLKNKKPEETPESLGLPEKTFEDELTLQMGHETVRLVHWGPAHTSGDTVVIFEKAKVIHAGDLYFQGLPPYVDVKDGSDTKNWISIIEKLGENYPDFRVIPGHGRATAMKEYLEFAEYLKYLRTQVGDAIKAGKSRQQAQESVDFSAFGSIRDQGQFLTKKQNVGWVYDEMTRKEK